MAPTIWFLDEESKRKRAENTKYSYLPKDLATTEVSGIARLEGELRKLLKIIGRKFGNVVVAVVNVSKLPARFLCSSRRAQISNRNSR